MYDLKLIWTGSKWLLEIHKDGIDNGAVTEIKQGMAEHLRDELGVQVTELD